MAQPECRLNAMTRVLPSEPMCIYHFAPKKCPCRYNRVATGPVTRRPKSKGVGRLFVIEFIRFLNYHYVTVSYICLLTIYVVPTPRFHRLNRRCLIGQGQLPSPQPYHSALEQQQHHSQDSRRAHHPHHHDPFFLKICQSPPYQYPSDS